VRDEAHAGVIGADQVAGADLHAADRHRPVDLDRLEPPLAGDRGDPAAPDRKAERPRGIRVANGTVDDHAGLALAMADRRRLTAEVGAPEQPFDHHHIARLGEIVGLGLAHVVNLALGCEMDLVAPLDVAHGDRLADDPAPGKHRLQQVCRHRGRDAERIHRIRHRAGEIRQRAKGVERRDGQSMQRPRDDAFGRDLAGQGSGHGVRGHVGSGRRVEVAQPIVVAGMLESLVGQAAHRRPDRPRRIPRSFSRPAALSTTVPRR
jgi:hypothetical protein